MHRHILSTLATLELSHHYHARREWNQNHQITSILDRHRPGNSRQEAGDLLSESYLLAAYFARMLMGFLLVSFRFGYHGYVPGMSLRVGIKNCNTRRGQCRYHFCRNAFQQITRFPLNVSHIVLTICHFNCGSGPWHIEKKSHYVRLRHTT